MNTKTYCILDLQKIPNVHRCSDVLLHVIDLCGCRWASMLPLIKSWLTVEILHLDLNFLKNQFDMVASRLYTYIKFYICLEIIGLTLHFFAVSFSYCIVLVQIFGRHLYGDSLRWRHLFCKCCFLESVLSTSLNESLWNFNMWWVSVRNRTLREVFWLSAEKNVGPKTTYFRWLCFFYDF